MTRNLHLLQKYINFKLRQQYHISHIPYDVISTYILSKLDWSSQLTLLYVIKEYFQTEETFEYDVLLNLSIGTIYQGIHRCADHIFFAGLQGVHNVFCHWTPFANRKTIPLANMCWSSNYPHARIYFDRDEISRFSKQMVKKRIYQFRFSTHEETFMKCKESIYVKNKSQKHLISVYPSFVITFDLNYFCKYFANEYINLQSFDIKI